MVTTKRLIGTMMGLSVTAATLGLSQTAFASGSSRPDPGTVASQDAVSAALNNANGTQDAMEIAFSDIFRQEVYRNVAYRGETLASGVLPSMSLTTLQASFFGSVTRFISENPALGGSFDRGFKPKIWNNMVKVLFERVVPMTPDGVLLLPTKKGTKVAALSPDLRTKGLSSNVRLFITDDQNQILGPSMTPIKLRSFETVDDGGDLGVGNTAQDYAQSASLQNEIFSSAVFMSQAQSSASTAVTVPGEEDYALMDCFGLVADGKSAEAKVCFQVAGQDALARGVEISKDLLITGARGGAAGAVVGSAIPGMGTGAGAAYGAATNMLMVIYNAFLKKESISPNAMRRLNYFISSMTYSPDVNGEIKVKPGMGRWVITKAGVIRQATQLDGRMVAVNIKGDLITQDRTVRVTEGAAFSFPQSVSAAAPTAPVKP